MIRDFEPDDLKDLDLLECYEGEPYILEAALNLYGAPGSYMRTVLTVRGEVLAIFGGLTNFASMNIWALATKNVRAYPIEYHKAFKKEMEEWTNKLNLTRIQSIVDADNRAALKQHLKLGFVIEGVMSKSNHKGQDQILLARVG